MWAGEVTVSPFTVWTDGQCGSLRLEEVIHRYVLAGHSHTAVNPDPPTAQSPPWATEGYEANWLSSMSPGLLCVSFV